MLADIDRKKIYTSAKDFFELRGSAIMKVSAEAAISICESAADRRLVISKIEGGIWHNPGFEARIDCIWDGRDPPVDESFAKTNNQLAAQFVQAEQADHTAFVITVAAY